MRKSYRRRCAHVRPADAVPAYITDEQRLVTIDTSSFTNTQRLAIAKDMNSKGFLVSINIDNSQDLTGAFGNDFIDRGTVREKLDGYLDDEEIFYCRSLSPVQIKKITTKPIVIGTTGDYEVSVHGDTLKVGCQEIPKDKAVKLAKSIIKSFGEA